MTNIRSKKAQSITTQPIIYLIGLIVIGMIFIFGFVSIKRFTNQTDEIGYVRFKENLKNEIEKISREYGGSQRNTFYLPTIYKKVCFVDNKHKSFVTQNVVKYPLVWNRIDASQNDGQSTDENVFLLDENDFKRGFDAGPIALDPPYFMCVNNLGGNIKLRFEGKGDSAKIIEDTTTN